jgi:uncharacterized protein DUF998
MQQNRSIKSSQLMLKMLLLSGAIAGPLFTVAWIVEGATRANYDPLRHPISSLSIGDLGWTQTATFMVTGLLTLAFALGLRRRLSSHGGSVWGPRLIAVIAIGLLGAGIFVTDPMNGFPLGTPNLPLHYSVRGRLHRLFSAFVFLGLPIACFVFKRFFTRRGRAQLGELLRGNGLRVCSHVRDYQRGFCPSRGLGESCRAIPASHAHHRLGLADIARRLHAEYSLAGARGDR